MDTKTRVFLKHIAVDAGVEKVIGNKSLMTAIANGEPVGIIRALQRSEGFLPDKIRDYHIKAIRTFIPATQAGTPEQWAESLSKTMPNWEKFDAETQDILVSLAGRVGVAAVAADEALAKSLAEGNLHEFADRVKALDTINPHKVKKPVWQRALTLADRREAQNRQSIRPAGAAGTVRRYKVQWKTYPFKKRIIPKDENGKDKYPAPGDNEKHFDDSGILRPSEAPAGSAGFQYGKGKYKRDVDGERLRKQIDNDEDFTETKMEDGTIGIGFDLKKKNYGSAIEALRRAFEDEPPPPQERYKILVAAGVMSKTDARKIRDAFIEIAEEEIPEKWLGKELWNELPGELKETLIELHFQMGINGLKEFKNMRSAIVRGDLITAGWEAWYAKDGQKYDPEEGKGPGVRKRRAHQAIIIQELDPRYRAAVRALEGLNKDNP
jgi:hypothetical protein